MPLSRARRDSDPPRVHPKVRPCYTGFGTTATSATLVTSGWKDTPASSQVWHRTLTMTATTGKPGRCLEVSGQDGPPWEANGKFRWPLSGRCHDPERTVLPRGIVGRQLVVASERAGPAEPSERSAPQRSCQYLGRVCGSEHLHCCVPVILLSRCFVVGAVTAQDFQSVTARDPKSELQTPLIPAGFRYLPWWRSSAQSNSRG